MRHSILAAAGITTLLAVAVPAAATEAEVDVSQATDASGATAVNHRYLVITSHTPEQCLTALDEMAAKKKKTLSKMQWGCKAGDHTGYMIVDVVDQQTALALLPESARGSAKVVELTKFTPKQLRAIHAKMDKGAAPAPQPAAK